MARQKKTPDKKIERRSRRGRIQAWVLGLIFLKFISVAFEEKHAALAKEKRKGADPEDKTEYLAENIFWVLKEICWSCTM